jgi:hypothetical protein
MRPTLRNVFVACAAAAALLVPIVLIGSVRERADRPPAVRDSAPEIVRASAFRKRPRLRAGLRAKSERRRQARAVHARRAPQVPASGRVVRVRARPVTRSRPAVPSPRPSSPPSQPEARAREAPPQAQPAAGAREGKTCTEPVCGPEAPQPVDLPDVPSLPSLTVPALPAVLQPQVPEAPEP